MAIFITGTDTNIGKTVISTWIGKNLNCEYWKPIQCGDLDNSDSKTVTSLANITVHPESYKFALPLSPHLAAQKTGEKIDPEKIIKPSISSLIVEGAGGIMVPINDEYQMIDLIFELDLPVIIVARSTLGTINHTCLTVQALKNEGIPILGVIMNGPLNPDNKSSIEKYADVEVLFEFPQIDEINSSTFDKVIMPDDLKKRLIKWL